MSATLQEAGVNPTATDGQPDPDTGKLFEVPRAKVTLDESDPHILKVSFGGALELDRTVADDVAYFNTLKAGETVPMTIAVHVAGSKKTHRRDSEGDVDAIVETKSLIVHSIDTQ